MKNLTFLFAAVGLLAARCTHYHYVPNHHNITAFQVKNEVRLLVATSHGDDYSGVELQTAWAPLNHFGVMANGIYASGSGNQTPGHKGRGWLVEAGVGYWQPTGDHGILEVWYGWGEGFVENTTPGPPNEPNAVRTYDLSRGFLQTSFTWRFRYLEYSISNRIVGLKHHNLTINNEPIAGANVGWYYLTEPAVQFSGGGDRIRPNVFFTRSIKLTPSILEVENFNFGVGVVVRLGRQKKWPMTKEEVVEPENEAADSPFNSVFVQNQVFCGYF